MAELTPLQEKLAEVLGLARAAPVVLATVEARDDEAALAGVRADEEEVRARCAAIAAGWGDEVRWGVLAHADYVERKAAAQRHAWVRAGTDSVQAYELMAAAEAGALAATAALGALNRGGEAAIESLVGFALPAQQRHLQAALDGCARCAAGALAEPEPRVARP
jgi:hypothetical protein